MDGKNDANPYRIPQDFNPYRSIDHARALTDALHQLVTEGEMTQRPASQAAYSNLVSLAELLQPVVHALHDYLVEIEDLATLPLADEDLETIFRQRHQVREERAMYAVR